MLPAASACKASRKDGRPCTAPVLLPSGYCFAHDPDNQATAACARADGGRAHSRAARVKASAARPEPALAAVLRPVLDRLLGAMTRVEDGALTPAQAQALVALAGAVVKVYTAGELEERMATLEAAAPSARPRP